MRIITLDDFVDTYFKIIQRGKGFFFSKFTFNDLKRTKSAFDNTSFGASNWWIIPKVKERWNYLISGKKDINYKQYLVETCLQGNRDLKLLSLGAGICGNEIELAENVTIFKEVVCLDIAENLLEIATKKARKKGLTNLTFICKSIDDFEFHENDFDIILFNSSLHHFKDVDSLLSGKIKHSLKAKGKLVINEFVGATRHQFSKNQISEINKVIRSIPKKFRKRLKSNFHKNKYRGVGILRMILADPSECIDSENIMPSIHKYFSTIVERPYGGNLLMSALRDISHNFVDLNTEKEEILELLFLLEDTYLENNPSDFIFGVYENIK